MASASASAVSAGRGGASIRSSRITMAVTWSFPARPLPVTAAFTSLGVCSATGMPRRAAHTIATAPACAVPITVRTLCWLNTRSTATASGRCSVSQRSSSASSASSRPAMSSPGGVLITSVATRVSARPGMPSITPTPHLVRPGSTPSTRIRLTIPGSLTNTCSVVLTLPAAGARGGDMPRRVAGRPAAGGRTEPQPSRRRRGLRPPPRGRRRSAELLHHLVGDRVVRVDVLHVVGVLDRLDQPEDAPGLLLVQRHLDRGQERGLGRLVVKAGLLQRCAHGDQVGGLADHLERLAEVVHFLGAGIQDRGEHVVLGDAARLADDDHALARE